jgi:hypothetical protein
VLGRNVGVEVGPLRGAVVLCFLVVEDRFLFTLSSNVAAAAIEEASLRAPIDATRELITINTNMLEILRTQYAKGYVSRLDVAAQEA